MTFDYSALATTADTLLKDFGQSGTLTKQTPGTYNTTTGKAALTSSTTACTVVFLSLSPSKTSDYEKSFTGSDKIEAKARFAYISVLKSDGTAISFDPEPGQVLTADGADWKITHSRTINPAGTKVIHSVRLMA